MSGSALRLAPAAWLALVLLVSPAGAQSSAPELPRSFVDTTYVPPTGIVYSVPAGGNLQAALDAALPGDVITLQAGATFMGPFTLPDKPGNGWIVVRTSAPDSSLPPPGTRIRPSYAPVLPKIVSASSAPALRTAPGAHHFRFIGVEFTVTPQVTLNYNLVTLGDGTGAQNSLVEVPHHLILDRVYIHGNANVNLRRGVALNSAWTAVIDSYISEVHEIGADSQALGGWNGPGPFKIVNNYLEGAGENVLFGGADPSIFDLIPSDIEVRGNHFFKPLSWRTSDPSYAGKPWSVKNLFELRNARRVLVEGNVFENNWRHAQNGFAILFTVRNQDGAAPWSVVEDVTFRLNILRHTASAINVLGVDSNHPSQVTKRILVKDNLLEDVNGPKWGGSGRLYQILSGTTDITIDHNTAFHTGEVIVADGAANLRFVYRNNLSPHNQYRVARSGTFGDPLGTLAVFFPGALFLRNVLMGGDALDYPAGNFFPASWAQVQFVNFAAGNHRLAAASPYKGAGTDGKDVGADMSSLQTATAGVVQVNRGGGTTPAVISSAAASSLAITSFTPSSDATNGYYKIVYTGAPTMGRLFFDTDRNAATGYPVNGIGANYLVELGAGYGNLYSYSGNGGGWGWTMKKAVAYTNAGGVANITVPRADLGSPGSLDVIANISDSTTSANTAKVTQTFGSPTPPPPPPPSLGYLPVIPGQAGYGMHTPAGRGGAVYKVTNRNASGAGSLRACTDASGPRVCVFEVSGNIDLGGGSLNIYNPFLTIAGQTAPAPGISIINGSFGIATHDVLVQHIRTRGGLAPSRRTPLSVASSGPRDDTYNVVVDHVSTAWSTDDLVLTWWGAHDVTWSHVLATGELYCPSVYFDCHGKAMITDSVDYNILMRDSALITAYQRMPLAQANPFVFVNNIVYNWGGVATQLMRQRVQPHQQNVAGGEFVLVGNHYRTGPLHGQAWTKKPILIRDYWVPGVHVHLNGNYAPDFAVSQQWDLVDNQSGYTQAQLQVPTPGAWPRGLVAKSAANGGIFDTVLNNVGAFPLSRDTLDARLIKDARNRTGGYVTSTTFPTLAQNYRALTLPANPGSDSDGDGYTNLEEWLHCHAAQVEGRACSGTTPPPPPPPSAPLAITSFTPTSDAANGYYKVVYTGTPTFINVFFDTDRNAATGFPFNGVGANYMVELGASSGNLYSYSGTGGAWGWTLKKAVAYTNTGGVANITVARADLGSPASIDVIARLYQTADGAMAASAKATQTFGSPAPPPPPSPPPGSGQQFVCTFPTAPTNCGFSVQEKVPGRASIVSFGRDGGTAVRLHTEPGDHNVAGSGASERNDLALSQQASDGYQGREHWWAHSVLFPSDYVNPPKSTLTSQNWGAISGFHHTGSTGQGNFSILAYPDTEITPDRPTGLLFRGCGGPRVAPSSDDPACYKQPIGKVAKNVWYDFVYHVKWSSGPDGFIDAWVRVGNEPVARRVLSHRGPTLYAGMGNYLKLANYHSPFGLPSSVIHDRVIRGTTWQGVSLTPLEGVPASGGADTQAPTVPANLVGTAVSSSQIDLSWSASTDNVAVKGYYVYLNDSPLVTTTGTTYSHSGLTPNTTYRYRVSAYDAVPNHSAWTATPVQVTTKPPSPPPPTGATLLFKSGFEGGTTLNALSNCYSTGCWQTITGLDSTTGFAWPPKIWNGDARFHLIAGQNVQVTPATLGNHMYNQIQTVSGRTGGQSRALYQTVLQSGGANQQTNLYTQNDFEIHPSASGQRDLYVSYWLKLQPDLLQKMTVNNWAGRVVTDWKTNGDYRVLLSIYGDRANNRLYWHGRLDNVANGGLPEQIFWKQDNFTVPVPVATWFRVETFVHRSAGADGRVWMAVNGQKLFDRYGPNMGVNNQPWNRIMPFLNYSSYAQLPAYQWVDDLEVWSGFPATASPN